MELKISGKELQQSVAMAAAVAGKMATTLPFIKGKDFAFSLKDAAVTAQNDGVISFTPEPDGGVTIKINPDVMVKTMQLMTPAYLAMVDVIKEVFTASQVFDGVAKDITAYEDGVRHAYSESQLSLEEVEKRTKDAEIAAKVNTLSDSSTWTPFFRMQVLAAANKVNADADADAETARRNATAQTQS